jgi:tetratricopeptide (TPR) repeat protein
MVFVFKVFSEDSYVVMGEYGKGVHNYGKALAYMRKTEFRAQQAATRNNLGRALASLGREERGYRICADALNLRRDLGGDVPIAYSLNTLALINNGMQRSGRAWYQAAQAAAYFRRAQNSRGLGLALIQLSMALRRLATQNEPGIVLRERPEQLYGTAREAIKEAIYLFDDENEPLRLVEAYIEAGSVIRDQIHLLDLQKDASRIQRRATDAVIVFQRAIDEAIEHDFHHLELEARVDLAWVFIHTGELDKAKSELDAIKGSHLIDKDYLLRSKKNGEKGVVPSGVNASYFYHELGKIHRFYALIAMQKFENRVQEIERGMSDREERQRAVLNDKDAQALLEESADSFVRSLLYGQLFSPRSRALVLAYNEIYDHLKTFKTLLQKH